MFHCTKLSTVATRKLPPTGGFQCPEVSKLFAHFTDMYHFFHYQIISHTSKTYNLVLIQASFVGCTAVDPSNPVDECPELGEPCADREGEFCCADDCPRNYCTAKQDPMSVDLRSNTGGTQTVTQPTTFVLDLQTEEIHSALNNNDGIRRLRRRKRIERRREN